MKIRRILASTALAGTIGFAAMTGAQAISFGDADQLASGVIENASCSSVRSVLDGLNATNTGRVYNKETTRNQLVQNLRQVTGTNSNPTDLTTLAVTRYTAQFADRALECGIVKADPETPFGSSQLNTLLNDFGPQISEMSSQATGANA